MPEPEEMICPLCRTVLGVADHHREWDEKSDGRMYATNWYLCPECCHVVFDWDDDYVWLPDENYPPF